MPGPRGQARCGYCLAARVLVAGGAWVVSVMTSWCQVAAGQGAVVEPHGD